MRPDPISPLAQACFNLVFSFPTPNRFVSLGDHLRVKGQGPHLWFWFASRSGLSEERKRGPCSLSWGFPGDSVGKVTDCNAGDAGDMGPVPVSQRFPGGGHGNPLQYPCLENPMDRERSLEGYSPWGHKELDMTEGNQREEP